ncbi:ABC-2 family transporter protein [Candidatus Curtissbacteria bacterium]|nr:ABC-2 family transporter protein [Candidatus Curtissbacteria bacterium]
MNKYFQVAKNTWDETVSYRLNFVMWRIRVVLQIITLYFLWLSILPKDTTFLGYNQSLMLTYILGTSLLAAFVLSSRSYSVGDEINQGNLSNFLIKPINYFLYHFARDVGDKSMNIVFSIFELTILFLLLRPPIFIQTDPFFLFLFLISAILALLLYFFFNFLLGLVGFWSPEVWAPRFIFFIVITFFAGGLFPLDILPKSVFTVFQLLPFPYLLYFPLKIYLGQLPLFEIFKGLTVSFIWLILMYLLVKFIWNVGLKLYTAQGR